MVWPFENYRRGGGGGICAVLTLLLYADVLTELPGVARLCTFTIELQHNACHIIATSALPVLMCLWLLFGDCLEIARWESFCTLELGIIQLLSSSLALLLHVPKIPPYDWHPCGNV